MSIPRSESERSIKEVALLPNQKHNPPASIYRMSDERLRQYQPILEATNNFRTMHFSQLTPGGEVIGVSIGDSLISAHLEINTALGNLGAAIRLGLHKYSIENPDAIAPKVMVIRMPVGMQPLMTQFCVVLDPAVAEQQIRVTEKSDLQVKFELMIGHGVLSTRDLEHDRYARMASAGTRDPRIVNSAVGMLSLELGNIIAGAIASGEEVYESLKVQTVPMLNTLLFGGQLSTQELVHLDSLSKHLFDNTLTLGLEASVLPKLLAERILNSTLEQAKLRDESFKKLLIRLNAELQAAVTEEEQDQIAARYGIAGLMFHSALKSALKKKKEDSITFLEDDLISDVANNLANVVSAAYDTIPESMRNTIEGLAQLSKLPGKQNPNRTMLAEMLDPFRNLPENISYHDLKKGGQLEELVYTPLMHWLQMWIAHNSPTDTIIRQAKRGVNPQNKRFINDLIFEGDGWRYVIPKAKNTLVFMPSPLINARELITIPDVGEELPLNANSVYPTQESYVNRAFALARSQADGFTALANGVQFSLDTRYRCSGNIISSTALVMLLITLAKQQIESIELIESVRPTKGALNGFSSVKVITKSA